MSGGGKLEVINTRERAVSQDVNRLQAFLQYDRAEIYRRMSDYRLVPLGGAELEFGSYADTVADDIVAVGTPLRADVIEGLCVLPQAGSLSLLVNPGCVFLLDPDGQAGSSDPNPPNPDDSRLKLVVDPGLLTVGVLVIGAGAGSTRIDVIECQRATTIVETDNRDIFDPSTGLFAAVAVTKVTEGRLTYRVRAGTPGAGLPANVQGWLPLCVASVPSTAVTVDDMTFWDVRPLVKDRVNAPADSQSAVASFDETQRLFAIDSTVTTTTTILRGYSTSQIGMYRAGGAMYVGNDLFVDLESAANQANGYTPAANTLWYLYAVFPGNLPRWVRYDDAPTTPRIPASPLGILTVSDVGPFHTDGNALLNVVPVPAATGLLSSGFAALLCAGVVNFGSAALRGLSTQGGMTYLVEGRGKVAAASAATTDDYNFIAGTDYPKNAKSLRLLFLCTLTAAAGTAGDAPVTIEVRKPGTATTMVSIPLGTINFVTNAGNVAGLAIVAEIPCVAEEIEAALANSNLELSIFWNQSAGTKSAPAAAVVGWRL